MKKTVAFFLASIMVFTAIFTGCGKNSDQDSEVNDPVQPVSTSENGGIIQKDFTIALKSDMKTSDPHGSNDTTSYVAWNHIYNRLIKITNQGELAPDLAEKWEKVSDTEWKFTLKQGVKFHDGSELKASDVKFSIERQKDHAVSASKAESIKEVKVDGDYELTFILEYPAVTFLTNLAHPTSSILSENAVKNAGENYKDNPIGTGPMKLKEWIPNDHYTLVRFDDYFGGACTADSLTVKAIPEGSSRTIALETGEVDVVQNLEKIDVKRVEENDKLQVFRLESPSIEYYAINVTKAPFDNVLVRQALNYAISKDNMVVVATEGTSIPAQIPMNHKVKGYTTDDMKVYEYNPEKAKELLKQAGYENGFSMTITASGDVRNREAQLIQADLQAIGITAEIELMEWGAFLDSINAGQFDTYISGWTNSSLDPDESLKTQFHTNSWGATGNRVHYSNKELDQLLDKGIIVTDDAERMEIYKSALKILTEECPWVPLMDGTVSIGARVEVKGIEMHPNLASIDFSNLYV